MIAYHAHNKTKQYNKNANYLKNNWHFVCYYGRKHVFLHLLLIKMHHETTKNHKINNKSRERFS